MVESLIESWPPDVPEPMLLSIYVKADQTQLWDLWASSKFPALTVNVRGIQRYGDHLARSTADITMAMDAVSDLLLDRVRFVVLFSDDSDFIAVCHKVREEASRRGQSALEAPFLWAVTDREGTRSAMIRDYFPNDYIHVVGYPEETTALTAALEARPRPDFPLREIDDPKLWEAMAEAIIASVPLGPFKSVDCRPIIEESWPEHPLARASAPIFGVEFSSNLWPILESRGVRLTNPNRNPRRYEMTAAAKSTLR